MSFIKKAWLTDFWDSAASDPAFTLYLESTHPEMPISTRAGSFPAKPTPEQETFNNSAFGDINVMPRNAPLRHVTQISLLDIEDLVLLHAAIGAEIAKGI
jgi:hypothetical protein